MSAFTMAAMAAITAALLLGQAQALLLSQGKSTKPGCGPMSSFGQTAKRARARNPGAGMTPGKISPYLESYMDGFMAVSCVKDSMHLHGDKFGDGKFSYELGDVSNVSIVNYDAHVAKEDQKQMTHAVCFAFCRTIPQMNYFGLTHGRDCYCTPYFKQIPGDSSECDAVCEGDASTMCGGMSKSSIFSMHSCDDAAKNLADATSAAKEESTKLTEVTDRVAAISQHMQSVADALQPVFGKVGDSATADLLQAAKEFAGTLEHAAEKGTTLATEMEGLEMQATGDKPKSDQASEEITLDLQEATEASEHRRVALAKLKAKANPAKQSNSSKLYYPIMYFVDKTHVDAPSTCGGTAEGNPIVGTRDECAAACDAAVGKCVGYTYMAPASLCFLFSKFTSVSYYTACGGSAKNGKVFLQSAQPYHGAADISCVAKFANFEGMNLTPDPSGKCDSCLKKASKAARCYDLPADLDNWQGFGKQKEKAQENKDGGEEVVPANNCPYGLPMVNKDGACTNLVNPWQKKKGIDCGKPWIVKKRCNQPSNTHLQYWQDCQFCAQACHDLGLGYDGLKC